MPSLKTILVVDDNAVNRKILYKMLTPHYNVVEAENGQEALSLLNGGTEDIAAIMLDLIMPILDGYGVLEAIRGDSRHTNLPVLVTTDYNNSSSEIKALALGAWDFVSKPYNPEIILFRLRNAIDRSQLSALKQLKYLAEYDALTGIFNKAKFFAATREMLDASRDECFAFLRFDVDRFQLINSFFGTAEGDRLLIYIGEHLGVAAKKFSKATYGRMESDIVGICFPYEKSAVDELAVEAKQTLADYNPNYDIVPSIGIYVIDDPTISVEEMYNRATLAAKTCKGNYVDYYAYYEPSMSLALSTEQEITNDMNGALANGQFTIYLQPKYNIHTNFPCGAEALVRWMHPQKGMLSPGEFIPVFERNGFITKLDYYVWEQACKCLHSWVAQGIRPYPLSVNVSRVNIYNPNLVEKLLELVNRYELEPALLNLELTESAYTDNPVAMKKVMAKLQSHGFVIMMDDFGSGYSSLSLLKDIEIDVLKIDMRFLGTTEIPGRGENIIASVIRMAKWLNIPVIAEGAETGEQVDFLRSVGCDFVQGHYFARAMPVADYERLCINLAIEAHVLGEKERENDSYDELFSANRELKLLFGNALQAAAIYEFVDDHIEIIRVNEAYYALLGHEDMLTRAPNRLSFAEEAYRMPLLRAFQSCASSREPAECEYMRRRTGGIPIWIHAKLRHVSMVGNKHIIISELTDITVRKELDSELEKYRTSWISDNHEVQTILIVDDAAINRAILKKILQGRFQFLEAENGVEALEILQENREQIDLILLDISMPVMDGKDFLKFKKKSLDFSAIPVIMITADNSTEQQIDTFSLGANDYIVKPFIPEVVTRRVHNVLEENRRFKAMVKEYNSMSAQVKTDLMTGLINRVSAEEMITRHLESTQNTCVMVMLDIDSFKRINDSCGHDYGDKVICAVAEKLRVQFRKDDIIARMGGDEFAIFIGDVSDVAFVEAKAQRLCKGVSEIQIDGENAEITCSVGIAVSSEQAHSFGTLYQNSDKALYSAKCSGRNIVSVYGEETSATSVSKWINDAESVLDAINDSVYACDGDTYEMIYANESFCRVVDVPREACKGRKCYEVLMHKAAPCDFCPLPKMEGEKVFTRLFQLPNTEKIFLMRGKNVRRDGRIVHLEVAVDVTEVENIQACGEGDAGDGIT